MSTTARKRKILPPEMPLDRASLTTPQAAEILGMGRTAFMKRVEAGDLDTVRRVRLRGGWLFDLYDLMAYAYPYASDDKIAEFVRDYREKLNDRRGNGREAAMRRHSVVFWPFARTTSK